MQATTTRPRIIATTDGDGVVSHAGSRLLADVADRTTLTGAARRRRWLVLRRPRARHDPGRVLVDMAVAVADGATTISDVAVLADQAELFGAVASDSTCWRLLDRLDTRAAGRGRSGSGRGPGGGLGAARGAVGRAVPVRDGRPGATCRGW